ANLRISVCLCSHRQATVSTLADDFANLTTHLRALLKNLGACNLVTVEVRDIVGDADFGSLKIETYQRFSVGNICGATVRGHIRLIVYHPGGQLLRYISDLPPLDRRRPGGDQEFLIVREEGRCSWREFRIRTNHLPRFGVHQGEVPMILGPMAE